MQPDQKEWPTDRRTYLIIGAAMEVHRELGHGFLEPVYHEALQIELDRGGIASIHEQDLSIRYKDQILSSRYRADFVCFNEVVVELKAVSELNANHEAQLLHYLKATGHKVGLLINFGAPSLQYKRMVFGFGG